MEAGTDKGAGQRHVLASRKPEGREQKLQ